MRPERLGISGVTLFGRYNYLRARPALPDHVHARDVEICYLVKGRQNYRVGGETYRLRGGDVFITFPGETHSTGGMPEGKGILYWMSLKAPALSAKDFLSLPAAVSRPMLDALLDIRGRHFRGSWEMKRHLDAATAACQRLAVPLAAARVACSLQMFLLEVIDSAARQEEPARARPLGGIVRAVREQPGADWSVPLMAEHAGLSTARFKARFKEENGVPPREFVMRTRIEVAEARLNAGHDSITALALELGFSSSQYFATVYKRFTGRTPGSGRCRTS